MVSAVFHSPLAQSSEKPAIKKEAAHADFTGAKAQKAQKSEPPKARNPFDWNGLILTVLPPVLGLALLVGIWALVSIGTKNSKIGRASCRERV